MTLEDIDVFETKTVETRASTRENVLTGQTMLVDEIDRVEVPFTAVDSGIAGEEDLLLVFP